MSETPTTPTPDEETQATPEPEPDQPAEPAPEGDDSDAEPETGRRPDFIAEAAAEETTEAD